MTAPELRWRPSVTVAAVIERDGRFLLVEEKVGDRRVLNQPAGHLEAGESLPAAARREALEETGWEVELLALLGVYRLEAPAERQTYLRFAFAAQALRPGAQARDPQIEALHWLDPAELRARRAEHRSPLVLACVEDYLAGRRFPLALLQDFPAG